jgi:hypothetical protein
MMRVTPSPGAFGADLSPQGRGDRVRRAAGEPLRYVPYLSVMFLKACRTLRPPLPSGERSRAKRAGEGGPAP